MANVRFFFVIYFFDLEIEPLVTILQAKHLQKIK